MKYLFYFLVLANLGFFVFEIKLKQANEIQGTSNELTIPTGNEQIFLIKELPSTVPSQAGSAKNKKTESTASGSKTSKTRANCYLIGPTQTQSEAENFLDLIKNHARDAKVIFRPGDVPNGWWILYPRALNRELALQNRAMLAQKGAHDGWIFESGPLQWAISLGLYETREKAQEAQKPYIQKNIMTELTPRMARGKVYWLRAPWNGSLLELEEIIQVLNLEDSSLQIPGPVPCD